MLPTSTAPRFIIFSIALHKKHKDVFQAELDEAVALIETYGGSVAEVITQNESHLNQGTYMGVGKVEELGQLVTEKNIAVVVVNENLSASQLYKLQTMFAEFSSKVQVWDRTDLILHIFQLHATTAEAKLQIKLAETRHKGPELYGMGKEMSQQGGGIGTRGQGETNTEIMKRHWQGEIKNIQAELTKISKSRELQMAHRRRMQLPTISIVGYTNAGKSTLFNALTRKKTLVRDAPFATLDSSVSKLYLHGLQKESFITDTIGFIQNIPTDLIHAFQSTLLETVHADLLLHVIDVSDQFSLEKIATVEQVLKDLKVHTNKKIYVFNKVDRLSVEERAHLEAEAKAIYADFHPLFISAQTGEGLETLVQQIEREIATLSPYL